MCLSLSTYITLLRPTLKVSKILEDRYGGIRGFTVWYLAIHIAHIKAFKLLFISKKEFKNKLEKIERDRLSV